MNKGYFLLSHDLLRQLLCLPDDTKIVAVDFESPIICKVWAEHEDIPVIDESREYQEVMPVFRTEDSKTIFEHW